MDNNRFINLKDEITKDGMSIIEMNLGAFRKLKDYKELYIYIIKVVTSAIIKSQLQKTEQYIVKVNFSNVSMKHADTGFASQLVKNLQEIFPNRLARCYLYYPPKIFLICWSVITPFIDSVTKDKFIVVTKNGELHINDYEDKFTDRI